MSMRTRDWSIVLTALLCTRWVVAADAPSASNEEGQQLAFPGAEGFGRFAQGGRGGDVYHVTTLSDDGPGSLRNGIRTATGPRTIVFDLSGTIALKSQLEVTKSYITIAGQTAPGDGICLRDQTFRIAKARHIIVRYMRFRLGDRNKPIPSGPDCVNTDDVDHMIFDHVTVSWGIDGNHDLRRGGNFTLQWSIYAEALNKSIHKKGEHGMLASFRDLTASISLHHNLFASSRDRHPTLGGSPRTDPHAIVDFRNNVLYNIAGTLNLGNCQINAVNNYFLPGPDTPVNHQPIATKAENKMATKAYLAGNVFERQSEWDQNNYLAIDLTRWSTKNYLPHTLEDIRAVREFGVGDAHLNTQSAREAYETVLRSAGASRVRDSADTRLVRGVRDQSHHMIDSQEDVGSWPALHSELPPADQDGDGMPDDWEKRHGLDPNDRTDGNRDRDKDGYTNLEEYLNSIVAPR